MKPKVVVIGGSGLIGSKVVEKLKQKGNDAVAAAPGEGSDKALAGAEIVVDVANSPFFRRSGRLGILPHGRREPRRGGSGRRGKASRRTLCRGNRAFTGQRLLSGEADPKNSGQGLADSLHHHPRPPRSSSSSVLSHTSAPKVIPCACRTHCFSRWRRGTSQARLPRRPSRHRGMARLRSLAQTCPTWMNWPPGSLNMTMIRETWL
jgi:hypothetical protein